MLSKKEKRQPFKGNIEKTISYIMAIPRNEDDIKDPIPLIQRLKESSLFNFKNADMKENITVIIEYKNTDYEIELIPESFELSDLYAINHTLTEENYHLLTKAECGVTLAMKFSDSIMDSYHLQLKVLYTILPDMIAGLDFCTERILSGVWIKLAALSDINPSPDYIYSIQAISGEHDDVWLHTHGLNRCGSIEIEILESDRENFNTHGQLLQTIAKRIISEGSFIDEEGLFFAARINNGEPLIVTWISWPRAIGMFDSPDTIGGLQDRIESHKENTGVIYAYACENDYINKKFTKLNEYSDALNNNSMMMLTTEETQRMSSLAKERVNYFIDAIKNDEVQGIMKMGLLVDEEFQNEDNTAKEHLWFEIKEICGDIVKALRTQDAYYIKNFQAQKEYELSLADLTDWIIYTKTRTITPDSVYLLEK